MSHKFTFSEIKKIRAFEKHLGYFGKDVSDVSKDIKDKGLYAILSAGMAVPLVSTACDTNPVTPEKPRISVTTGELTKNTVVPGARFSANGIWYTDNGAGDLNKDTPGVIEVEVEPGNYTLDYDIPGTSIGSNLTESNKNWVAQKTEVDGTRGSISVSGNVNLDAYGVRQDFDWKTFIDAVNGPEQTHYQWPSMRFRKGNVTMWITTEEKEWPECDEPSENEPTAQAIQSYTLMAQKHLPKLTDYNLNFTIQKGGSKPLTQFMEVAFSKCTNHPGAHGEHYDSQNYITNSIVDLNSDADLADMTQEMYQAVGFVYDTKNHGGEYVELDETGNWQFNTSAQEAGRILYRFNPNTKF